MNILFLSFILLSISAIGTAALVMVWTDRGDRYQTLREQGKVSDCQATRRTKP